MKFRQLLVHRIRRTSQSTLRNGRNSLSMIAMSVVLLGGSAIGHAATVINTSITEEVQTNSPNNDNYVGAFDSNRNRFVYNSAEAGTITNIEAVFAVEDSGGTSEYALTIRGSYNRDPDPLLEEGYRLQVGFGTGVNFTPAADVFPELDFDAPLPSRPQVPAEIGLGPFTFFTLGSHTADSIFYDGHATGIANFFHNNLFQLPIDIPDLPAAVMDYYGPEDLPADFPAEAKAFTIRGHFGFTTVPEPSTVCLLVAGVALSIRVWRRHG